MGRIWESLKRIYDGYPILLVCFWVMVWAVGSYHSGRVLGLDDLIPTANKWLENWR